MHPARPRQRKGERRIEAISITTAHEDPQVRLQKVSVEHRHRGVKHAILFSQGLGGGSHTVSVLFGAFRRENLVRAATRHDVRKRHVNVKKLHLLSCSKKRGVAAVSTTAWGTSLANFASRSRLGRAPNVVSTMQLPERVHPGFFASLRRPLDFARFCERRLKGSKRKVVILCGSRYLPSSLHVKIRRKTVNCAEVHQGNLSAFRSRIIFTLPLVACLLARHHQRSI
jgi:hypothetical protein